MVSVVSGMPHFEVHTLADDRWMLDGIFLDKQTAVDDAKLLLARLRALDAVRVLQVEEQKSGFLEWTIFTATRPARFAQRVKTAPPRYRTRPSGRTERTPRCCSVRLLHLTALLVSWPALI